MKEKVKKLILGKSLREKQLRTAYLFIAPCIAYFFLIFIAQIPHILYLSFHAFFGLDFSKYVGLSQFLGILREKLFWASMWNTLYFSCLSIPSVLGLSLGIALLLHYIKTRIIKDFFKALYFLPTVCSLVAAALIWSWIYEPNIGLLNNLFLKIGLLPQTWLHNPYLVIPSLVIMNVWVRLGLGMIIFVAGLESIPMVYYEAARIDGANRLQQFLRITLPLLNPQIMLVLILETIFTLQIFDLPYVATEGGPANASRTIVLHLYQTAFKWNRPGKASAISLYLFAMILILTVVQWKISRKRVMY